MRSLLRLDHLLYEGYLFVRQAILDVELAVDVCDALTPVDVGGGSEVLEGVMLVPWHINEN